MRNRKLVVAVAAAAMLTTYAAIPTASGAGGAGQAARAIAEVPLTQAFRYHIGMVGNLSRSGSVKPFSITTPTSAGVAVTEVYSPTEWGNSSPSWTLGIRVNGLVVFNSQVGPSTSRSGSQNVVRFSPPVLVPPGATLEVGLVSTSSNRTMVVGLGGYFLTRADLGM